MKYKFIKFYVLFSIIFISACTDWEKEAQVPMQEGAKLFTAGKDFVSSMYDAHNQRHQYAMLLSTKMLIDVSATEKDYADFLNQPKKVNRNPSPIGVQGGGG